MSTDLELFTYENTEVRAVIVEGRRCAVAADICAALDIKDTRQAVERLDEADRYLVPLRSGGQMRQMWVVTEDGATDLVLDSRKPEARKFRRFLTHEVWPSIRDTGSYSVDLTEDEIIQRGYALSMKRVEALTAEVAELKPKAEFYDDFMDADGCYSMGAAAKAIGWGRNVMMRELRRAGVLQGNNLPYQRYAHHFKVVPQTFTNRKTGELQATATTFVYPSGIPFIRKRLVGSLEIAVTA